MRAPVGKDRGVTEQQRSPIDAALDLLFFAPVGLALTAREELPRLIEKGRSRVSGQVTMARMVGQFAVNQGGQEAEKFVKQAAEALVGLGILPGGPRRPAPSEAGPPAAARAGPGPNGNAPPARAPRIADADALGIQGSDSPSASQVLQRPGGASD